MAKNDMQHEFDRIEQFRTQAGASRAVFEKKILDRARKSTADKKTRFADALDQKGETALAQQVRTA